MSAHARTQLKNGAAVPRDLDGQGRANEDA
jgi:hypothetical protein